MRGDLAFDLVAAFEQRAPDHAGRQKVARLDQAGSRHAERNIDDAVLDRAALAHHHHQRPAGAEIDELDMAQLLLRLRRHHQGGAMR